MSGLGCGYQYLLCILENEEGKELCPGGHYDFISDDDVQAHHDHYPSLWLTHIIQTVDHVCGSHLYSYILLNVHTGRTNSPNLPFNTLLSLPLSPR